MGTVYEAADQRLSRTVALKETLAETDELRHAFEREARLLANLRHSALPKIIDHFIEGDGQYLVMEFIPGEDLGAQLERRESPFEPPEALRWAEQLLDALEYLHTHQPPIIHRDIKPSNLKVMGEGQIVLLDFGLAKGRAGQMSTLTSNKSIHGYTPSYAPLEQIQGEGTDPRSDLYSLGATLYHLMTGIKPPDAIIRAAAAVNGQPDPLRPAHEVNNRVPVFASTALMRAMALNPQGRPRTAAEMRRYLRNSGTTVPSDEYTDEDEATRVRSSAGNTGVNIPGQSPGRLPLEAAPLRDIRRVEIPVERNGSNSRSKWVVAGLLFILLASLFVVRFALHTTGETRRAVTKQPVPGVSAVKEIPSPASEIDNQNSAIPDQATGSVEQAREKLAQKNIPFDEKSFLRSIEKGDVSTVKLFVEAGMPTRAKDENGQTALMTAAFNGHNHIARILLDGGANVNAKDNVGSTALMGAALNDHKETLDVLLSRGADVNSKDNEGQTALSMAAKQGHTEIVRMLLNGGAKVNVKDKEGHTALMWAEINNHTEVAQLLREAGAREP